MNRSIATAIHAIFGSALLLACATPPLQPRIEVKGTFDVRHAIAPADAYYEMGRFFQGQKHFDKAADAYRKAIAVEPRHAEAYNALGTVLALQGHYAEACVAFESAITIAPGEAHLHNNLGYAYLLWNRKAEALAALRRAVELDTSDVRYRNNLARAGGRTLETKPAPVEAPAAPIEQPLPPAKTSVASAETVEAATPRVEIIAGASTSLASRSAATQEIAHTQAPAPTVSVIRHSPQIIEIIATRPMSTTIIAPAPPPPTDFRLEVSNGNGVAGMARYVGTLLADEGLPKARLTNQTPFVQPATEIQYRPGFSAQAHALSERLPGRPDTVAGQGLHPATDVRVVLGHDLPRTLTFALNVRRMEVAQMAYAGSAGDTQP